MISQHRDGEFIARAVKFFGIDSVRGSTTHGSLSALRGMIRFYRKFFRHEYPAPLLWLVVAGVGITASVDLAARAGLETGTARIQIDPEWVGRHTREFIYDERLSLI